MESSIQERENTLKIIDKHLNFLSRIYRECYLQKGRGAIVLYPSRVENVSQLSCVDYNTKDESLDLFDNRKSRKDIAELIENYDPKNQGILILITKTNATWFVTVKLKSATNKSS
jgi:hypothetical protein